MTVDVTPVIDTSSLEDIVAYEPSDNPDVKAHIVNPDMNRHIWQPGMTAQDIVNIARLQGKTITALCGYRWIPRHDPDKHATCDPCLKIASKIIHEEGG
jgi:hypothetical protein